MAQYIDKADVVAEIEARYNECLKRAKIIDAEYWNGKADAYRNILDVLDTLEMKEVDLTDKKPDWRPSKKQIESLGALVRYNIGVFDYQKLNEVAILYDDLTKI